MSPEKDEMTLTEDPTGNPEDALAGIEEEKKRQLEEKGISLDEPKSIPLVEEPPEEPKGPEVDKSPKPGAPSAPVAPTVPFAEDDKAETEEWMKKKGFKNVQAMAQSMRDLERKFHSERAPTPGPSVPTPAPPARAPEPYGPPQYPVDGIAKHYNVDPEDLQKIGRISSDIAGYEVNRQVGPLKSEIRRLNQEIEKRSAYDSVERDPTFNDPTVLREMHEIVDGNPSIVKSDPRWMRSVHTTALQNIGRRYLEKGVTVEPTPAPKGQGPTRPPPSKGGSGPAGPGNSLKSAAEELTPEQVAALPLAEHEKYLRKHGLIPPEE